MHRIISLFLGFIFLGSWAGAQENPVETYKPCVEATQRFRIPEQIHLALPGQLPPEPTLKLSFLFSEGGIDIYGFPGDSSRALFVYQDERNRREQLGYFINSQAVSWRYFDTSRGRQNWEPIVSLKYAVFRFSWLNLNTSPEVAIVGAEFYAPLECVAQIEFPNTLASSAIGSFLNMSPASFLPHDSLAYRVAVALRKSAQVVKAPNLVLKVTAAERSWVAVDADGKAALQRVLKRGEVQTLRAQQSFDVTFDTRAVVLTLNGETVKPKGRSGVVKSLHLTSANLKQSTTLGSVQTSKTEGGELSPGPKQTPSPPETAGTANSSVVGAVQVEKPNLMVLQVTATERAWVVLGSDGNTTGERMVNPGEVLTLRARWYFDVTAGNAGAFALTLNGEALKSMGRHNELKSVHLTRADLKHSTP